MENPALKQFAARVQDEFILAQALVRRLNPQYEVRHVDDRSAPEDSLRLVAIGEIRQLAQYTAAGEFRPLKSAPTLVRGWRLLLANEAELELALNRLYPGAIADLYAANQPNPPVTHYRDYANRQTGMFRITGLLSDAQVAEVIRECCVAELCLKRRFWTVPTVAADAATEKSVLPCLEPCALLMEAARKNMRAAQEAKKAASQPN